MLIATFDSTTDLAGKTITREGDAFVLQDHGPISARDVMEFDKQGQLVWSTEGAWAWVGSLAQKAPVASADTPDSGAQHEPSPAMEANVDVNADAAGADALVCPVCGEVFDKPSPARVSRKCVRCGVRSVQHKETGVWVPTPTAQRSITAGVFWGLLLWSLFSGFVWLIVFEILRSQAK
jgi:hypothetical protein